MKIIWFFTRGICRFCRFSAFFYYITLFWAPRRFLGAIKIATESWECILSDPKVCSTGVDLLDNIPRFSYRYPPLSRFFGFWRGGICRILKKSSRNENFPQNPTVIRCKTSSKTENFTIVYIFGKHIYRRFPLEILSICIYQMKIEHILLLIFRCRFWLLQFFLLVRLCASKHKAHAFKTLMKVCTVLYV